MKKIKRTVAIEKLANDRVEMIKDHAYTIAKDGIKGFNDMTNEELEIDYESAFGEKIKII